MGREPRYSKPPTDWLKKKDIGSEMVRVSESSNKSGCYRFYTWLMLRGIWRSDGSIEFNRNLCAEELGVGVKSIDRWRLEVIRWSWLKRHTKNSRLWVNPMFILKRIGDD